MIVVRSISSSSIRSTVCVHRSSSKSNVTDDNVRRVRFDSNSNVTYTSEPIESVDIDKLFYNRRDVKRFKANAVDTSRLLKTADSLACNILQRYYAECCRSKLEPSSTIYSSLTLCPECMHMKQAADKGLVIGLEKLMVPNLGKDRSRRLREIYELVLDVQDYPMSSDERSELIRKGCENITRPNRLFAVAVAQAHSGYSLAGSCETDKWETVF